MKKLFLLILLLFTCFLRGIALPLFSGLEHLFETPRHYVACYTNEMPAIDGDISDAVWDNAAWSEYFRDIQGDLKPEPPLKTRMKMLWNDTYLFIAAEMEEPHVWAYLENHDEIVYYDNDFEVFIDPYNTTHFYYEIEYNARNTVFDMLMPKPYRNGGGAFFSWDTPGLKSAVRVHGSLNDPSDVDKGWTIEMAIPFAAVTIGNSPDIPGDGRIWRINFSRVEWHTDIVDGKYEKKKNEAGRRLSEENWVWSPQGVVNMHYPERWGYLQFSKETDPANAPSFVLPYSEKQRQYLWLVYHRQKDYIREHKRYAETLSELGIETATFHIDGKENTLTMEATSRQFSAVMRSAEGDSSINDEGLTH